MANIELVIKIPEEKYKHIMSMQFYIPCSRGGESLVELMLKTIRNGAPLQKGHGRLGDLDALEMEIENYSKGAFAMTPEFLVKDAPTIIEADRAESEE